MTTIDEYIKSQPEDIQEILQKLRKAISSAAPNAVEKISWKMPTFWQEENLIHFAAFKQHIGIYPGSEAVSIFAEKLNEYKTSKGAIQFPLNKPIDYKLITEITRWRVQKAKEGKNESKNL